MNEGVEELGTVGSVPTHAVLLQTSFQLGIVFIITFNGFLPSLRLPVVSNLVENIDFIIGGLQVVLGAFLDLHGYVVVVLEIL